MKKLITLLLTFFGVTAANAQCNHTLTMIDSWGDGWNGASVDVNVNGVAVLSGVSCAGASTDETFTASTGDAILLANWVSGSYDGEISWELKDGSGTIIQSGVWGDATGGAGACPSCNPPSTLAVANVTTTTADFSWVAGGSETAWNVEYGAAGFTQGTGTSVPVTAASYAMTGLTANTAYDVYVQADCGAAQSVFAGPTLQYNFDPNIEEVTFTSIEQNASIGVHMGLRAHLGPINADVRFDRGISPNELSLIEQNGIPISGRIDTRSNVWSLGLSYRFN